MYRLTVPPETVARQVARQLELHPDCIPVVVELDSLFLMRIGSGSARALEGLENKRFAPLRDWTVGQFQSALRSRLHLKPSLALFMFLSPTLDQHVLPVISSKMADVYRDFHDPTTGMLYVTLALESTFG